MKKYADKGKYAAPRWLVYPQLSAWTIGWRMGYGEDYALNEPFRDKEFSKLFPQPLNWLFNPRKSKFDEFVIFAFLWSEDGTPKYTQTGDDYIEVNDFITPQSEKEFTHDSFRFRSIEHMVLFSKYASFEKCDRDVTLEKLKKGFELSQDELELWETFKYTVCLNASYYKIMQDKNLKEKLLATADRPLVYVSDDEWGGEENLFGFALMELRDEIRRLCENENLIDWEYTRYLQQKNPYENDVQPERDVNDRQSPEYRVIEATFENASRYVRDVNLDSELADKYETGQIIHEKGFVDASKRIGGMITSHRYLILSGYMMDLSEFEKETNWGLHVANKDSNFKVADIFTVGDKTQILLLQLPEGFEEIFKNKTDVEDEFIERERENFRNDLEKQVIEDLATEAWLQRCEFPLGMSDDGEFFQTGI